MINSVENSSQTQFLPNITNLEKLINTNKDVKSVWGVAPTAPLHLGYDSLILAQKELINFGFTHTIILADYHAMLTHGYSLEQVSKRTTYYENYLRHCCEFPAAFVRGSNFQTRQDYIELLYSTLSNISISDTKKSLSKVSKSSGIDNMKVSAYIYGIMQCLDCEYLNVDLIFAARGQSKIYKLFDFFHSGDFSNRRFCEKALEKDFNKKSRTFIYVDTGVDIRGQPLNQSNSQTRISIHETENSLKKKIKAMFAPPSGQIIPHNRVNALLEYFKYSVFPWRSEPIKILDVDNNWQTYFSFDPFYSDYQQGILHPNDCKAILLVVLWERLEKVQKSMGSSLCDWIDHKIFV